MRALRVEAMVLALMSAALLAGCSASPGPPVRMMHLDDRLFRAPPRCVIVLPVRDSPGAVVGALDLERAVERHLLSRFNKVIAGPRRDRMARRLALDPSDASELREFARHTRCGHAFLISDLGSQASYAVVWAERRVVLDATLFHVDSPDRPLWHASGEGVRGDGGVPLSPLSLAGAVARAARVADDGDQAVSLLDDVLRGIFGGLPDLRG